MIDDSPDYYLHTRSGFISKASKCVRNKIFTVFMAAMQPTELSTVLDVGATPDMERDESNFFERLYPYPDMITAAGIEDASILEKLFPGLRFVRTSGVLLPFKDNAFDIAFSNAVVEHVGSRDKQKQFIAEIIRVSRKCVIAVPDRFFPVEHHTALPLLHYLPQKLHRRILTFLGRDQYSHEESLNLISISVLQSLIPSEALVKIHRVTLFGIPSNLVAVIEKNKE